MRLFLVLILIIFGQVWCFGQSPDKWKRHDSPIKDTLHNAFFISDRKGWAISHATGLVLHTSDGGVNWKIQARLGEGYLETIVFLDAKRGWICGANGRLFATTNGGKTWNRSGNFERTDALSSVHFFDRRRGFVFGIDLKTRRNLIFATGDGGKSWNDRSNEITAPFIITDAIFALDANTLFVGGNGFVLQTQNQGKNWRVIETKTTGLIRGLYFTDGKNGWAVGQTGLVIKTADGGETWEKQKSFTTALLRSVAFADGYRTAFIAGDLDEAKKSLWKSQDNGASWYSIKNTLPDLPALHRVVVSPKRIWLFGAEGTIISHPRRFPDPDTFEVKK